MNNLDFNELALDYKKNYQTNAKTSNKPLHNAVLNNDVAQVSKLIKEGVGLNQIDESLKTALMLAIEQQNTEIITLLLDGGCDPRTYSYVQGSNALLLGCIYDLEPGIFMRILKTSNLETNNYTYKCKFNQSNSISALQLCFTKPTLTEEILNFLLCYQNGYIFSMYPGDSFKAILGEKALAWYEDKRSQVRSLEEFQKRFCNYKGKFLDKSTKMDCFFLVAYVVACLLIYGFYLSSHRNMWVPVGTIGFILISIPVTYSFDLVFCMPLKKLKSILLKTYYFIYKKVC